MRKFLLIALILLAGCSANKKGDRYYIVIYTKDLSAFNMGRSSRTDSIFAPDLNSAYDSLSRVVMATKMVGTALGGRSITEYEDCDLLNFAHVSVLNEVPLDYRDSIDKERAEFYKNHIEELKSQLK